MIWKKIISLLIVAVFVISGLAVVYNTPAQGAEGQYVDKVKLSVNTNRNAVIGAVATGDIDVFIQALQGSVYDGVKDEWKEKLGTWKSEGSYNNLFLNPAHEPDTDYKYLCDVSGQLRFNPFAVRKVRYAMNFLVNREKICQDLGNGFAQPRYLWLSSSSGAYKERFSKIIEDHDITASGQKQKGIDMINNALSEIQVTEGQLRSPSESSSSYWQYQPPGGSWRDVTVKGIHRIEDWRQDIGAYVSGLLEDAGIKVDVNKWARDRAVPTVFDGDYDNLPWGYYTGGWLASGNVYYQELACSQMYAPFYGYMPTRSGEANYQYENETLDSIGQKLLAGKVNSKEQYWSMLMKQAEAGLNESVRVFLCTEISYYVHDKDAVKGMATDAITGWSDYYSAPTIQTDDGVLDAVQYSSQAKLYMDNWNKFGGSTGAYGAKQRRMIHDTSSWNHPVSGLPEPVRCNWRSGDGEVVTDYKWEDGNLTKNVEVPTSAVNYNTDTQTWEEVGSGVKSAVKCTYDLVEGKWHDGHDLTVRDVMASYAFDKDITYLNNDTRDNDYYHGTFSGQSKSWYENVVATRWNQEEGTFTIWGDYTFPLKEKVGSYFTVFPWLPYQSYEACQQLVTETDLASGMNPYTYDSAGEGNWVHWLSKDQGADFKTILQRMKDQDWRPPYVKSENNAPITISQSEYESQIDSIISFYDEYKHFYDSNGAFKLTDYDSKNSEMTLERFTKSEGYPWSKEHWGQVLQVASLQIGAISAPEEVTSGQTFTVDVSAFVDEDFPDDKDRAVKEIDKDTVMIEFINTTTGEVVANITDAELTVGTETSTYKAEISTAGLGAGAYKVEVTGYLEAQSGKSTNSATVYVKKGDVGPAEGNEVLSLTLSNSTVEQGESVTVEYEVQNHNTSDSKDIDLLIDGTIETTETVDAGATETFTYEIDTTDMSGDYEIKAGDMSKTLTVTLPYQVMSLSLSKTTVDQGNNTEATFNATNPTTSEKKITVYVDDKAVANKTIAANTTDEEFTVTIDTSGLSEGDHTVKVGTQEATLTVNVPGGDNGDDNGGDGGDGGGIPGFTFLIMLVSAISAIGIYHRKKRR